jgi:trimethylamine:corrinoid methyltransferase-like protein
VPSSWNDLNLRQVRLFLAGQALSLIYTPPNTSFREKSGLLGAASNVGTGELAVAPRLAAQLAGQTDLPSSVTAGSLSNASSQLYARVG